MTPPLIVVALGGNVLAPPAEAAPLARERALVRRAAEELAPLARRARLLLVHGNAPQVGRLLAHGDVADLDVHVAHTQGELGYLLAAALDAALGTPDTVAVVTRVVVAAEDPAFAAPTKPIGRVLDAPPAPPALPTPDGRGWRQVVASPRPTSVVELDAIRLLLARHHVVAGGGGGVPLAAGRLGLVPQVAVVDKDWVAALLAIALDAAALIFVTDVPAAADAFGTPAEAPLARLAVAAARERLERGVFAPGSMAPKIESASMFVEATGRLAVVTTLGAIEPALRGEVGTTVART